MCCGLMDVVSSRQKREKDRPDCYQCKVQKPLSVMVWGCVTNQGMVDGTISAERNIQVLEQHMLPSKQCLFFRDIPAYFSKTVQSYILHVLQHGFVVKECRY